MLTAFFFFLYTESVICKQCQNNIFCVKLRLITMIKQSCYVLQKCHITETFVPGLTVQTA